ncbi:hypothetical protein [Facklamia sp. P12955]|uniref:hypothetical protein n=1 Tax=Facklamia sp. P12955 TaxID=3421946 RepID=UPI003D179B1D
MSPKARRQTRRQPRQALEQKIEAKGTLSQRDKALSQTVITLSPEKAHLVCPRKKYAGDPLQMDASQHQWFEGDTSYYHLHTTIDDAMGRGVGASFDTQETLNGYSEVTQQFLTKYGIPYEILTDNRSIFDQRGTQRKEASLSEAIEQKASTQFGYACQTHGIQLSSTSILQTKGPIERLLGMFQDRLFNEMKLANIQTIQEANCYLPSILETFNNQIALSIKPSITAFERLAKGMNLDPILARFNWCRIQAKHAIQYQKHRYRLIDQQAKPVYLNKKTKVLVIESRKQELFASYKDQLYALEEIHRHKSVSENL